ncbi:MAG: J domain-containing protein [Chloroflexi bacterium]|nr:J domain-containing protein [Chloroflexota bacterium]
MTTAEITPPTGTSNGPDPYAVLGVSREASSTEVRLAYLQKVREHSPERDPEGFKRIRAAYELLRSPRKRAELQLLEFDQAAAGLDEEALREVTPPSIPARFVDDLIAAALAEIDTQLDMEAARAAPR